MAQHAPSAARSLTREAQREDGRPLELLIDEARALANPASAAPALATLASDPRAEGPLRARVADELPALVSAVAREWQRAEVAEKVLRATAAWPEDLLGGLRMGITYGIVSLPDGEGLQEAFRRIAPKVDPPCLERLLDRALGAPLGVQYGKPVVKAWVAHGEGLDRLHEVLAACADPEVRARLAGAAMQQAARADRPLDEAWTRLRDDSLAAIDDPAVFQRSVHALAQGAHAVDEVRALAAVARAYADPEVSVRAETALAARLDRLGETEEAGSWLEALGPRATAVGGAPSEELAERIQAARARLGGKKPPKRERTKRADDQGVAVAPRVGAGQRHVLVLADTYHGALTRAHFRALARAAPLCAAFDLDLVLLGFPGGDVPELVERAAQETNLGSGGAHLRALVETGRVQRAAWDEHEPAKALGRFGRAVATTSEPDPGKRVPAGGLADAAKAGAGPLCLVVGLGRQGLPGALLDAAPWHYELTGRGVALETATAMGILAERLGRCPPPGKGSARAPATRSSRRSSRGPRRGRPRRRPRRE